MRGARCEVGVVEVVWLHAGCDEGAHQRGEHLGVVVDALEQDRLAQHRNAGVDDPRAGGAGRGRQLAGVVGVEHDISRAVPSS